MLVLSRKKDEKIVINDDIQIQIVDIKSDTVKLGIEAPKYIKIHREEVWKTIQQENIQADTSVSGESIKDSLSQLHDQLTRQHKTLQTNKNFSQTDSIVEHKDTH